MENLHRLAQRVLRELHEPVTAEENPNYPWVAIYQALNAGKDEVLVELLLSGERYRTILFPTDTWAYFSTPASGNRVGTLPSNFVRAAVVEVLVGTYFYPIEENRPKEGRSEPSPHSARMLSRDTGYYIEGDGLFLDHDSAGPVANAIRVRMERDCPDLLVGKPAANTIANTSLILAQTDNEAIGQIAAVLEDHAYLGLYLQWIQAHDPDGTQTQGALLNTRKRIIAYTGDNQTCTMDSAWTDPPLPLATDTYAMQTPFQRALDMCMVHYAAGKLAADAGEDPGPQMTIFFNKMEKWMEVYDQRSNAQRRGLPYEDDPD